METSNKELEDRQDRQHLNYIVLTTMITNAMQRKQGKRNVDFDLAADIAQDVSQQMKSDVLIQRKEGLTVKEILASEQVKQAAISREHEIPWAEKKPKEDDTANIIGVLIGIAGTVGLAIIGYFAL